MFTWNALCSISELREADIRFVLSTLLNSPVGNDKVATSGEALALLVYDLLQVSGFPKERTSALVKFFKPQFIELGRTLDAAKLGDKTPLTAISIADNRYAFWVGRKEGYDLTELVVVEKVPVPVLSLSIVLPKLYQRALRVLSEPDRQHSGEEAGPRPEVVHGAGSE